MELTLKILATYYIFAIVFFGFLEIITGKELYQQILTVHAVVLLIFAIPFVIYAVWTT